MANVVKLVNGGAIQVRTGVIQGIGPVGPRGVAGVQGAQGDQGPVGETGPMGTIQAVQGRSNVGTTNALAANTDTVIAFGDIKYDDPSCFYTSANILLRDPGDYMLSVYLAFDDAAAGSRSVWFASQSAVPALIARTTRQSVAGAPFYMDLTYPYRVLTGNEYVNVLARSSVALNVSSGAITVTRVGSGPKGDVGPPGVQGPNGATGAQGPAGPSGTANAGFTKYADLLPH